MDLLDDLEYRGLVYQVTDHDALAKRLNTGPITLYNGFDPTADSLTIGNLVTILILRRFQLAGHHPIAVAGGGTGLIGDPSGKNAERQLNTNDTVEEWTEKLKLQLGRFLDFGSGANPARIVNNYSWLKELDLISFLRDVGKYFPVNYMLAKESVSARLEGGISFTEFSYMVLQSYDFLWLRKNMDCELQTGGSDQWGNITAGADLIRRVMGEAAFGLTCPLITSADGTKLGKTEAGAIWLDADRTSPYELYQYFINVSDEDVANYLKVFTFLAPGEIRDLEVEVAESAAAREAQRKLAREVTSLVHGPDALLSAERISQALFYGNIRELTAPEIEQALNDVPSYTLQDTHEIGLVDLLARASIAPSKRRAREDITNGAITMNDERIVDTSKVLGPADRVAGKYIIVRRGKNKYHLVKWLI
jgi:tyrosyl-tRNA synthetase